MQYFKNINDLNHFFNLDDSKHPLIDVRKYSNVCPDGSKPIKLGFYKIGIKKNFNGFIEYGKTKYDSTKGVMYFIEPGQIYSWNSDEPWDGYHIFLHPDIFKNHYSAKNIKSYNFFSYEINEALFLTEKEESTIGLLIEEAIYELNKEDEFSVSIVLSYISTILNITERFYTRQFNTRKTIYNQLTSDFLQLLQNYYADTKYSVRQPSVNFFSEKLNVTPKYLSDIIKNNTNKPALTIIHEYVIEEAKRLLKNSNKTVSEVSFTLGFEYPNYFSRLFKKKTNLSPSEYRESAKSI